MSVVTVWITDNFDTVINWIIAIAAVIIPLVVHGPAKERIVVRKNLFAGYSVFLVKVTFYYFTEVFIASRMGRFPSHPLFIAIGGVICAAGGLQWSKQMDVRKQGKTHGRCWTRVLVIMPVLCQGTLYLGFMNAWWRPWVWMAGWTIGNLLTIVLAACFIDDHDFFEYQQVNISLVGDSQSYTFHPEFIQDDGAWITVNKEVSGKTTKFSAANLEKIEYDKRNRCRVSKAMPLTDKLFRVALCFCYMLMIGVASQFLLGAVVEQIAVSEEKIYLEPGELYQLDAVALNKKAGELSYSISGSSAVTVSEKGMIAVISDVPEEKRMTATITISDEIGNSAKVQVIVKNGAVGKER